MRTNSTGPTMGKQLRMATIVFAKEPGAGTAKTRIAAAAGPACAERIYRELLAQTAAVLAAFDLHVAWTDADSPVALRTLFPAATSFFPQRGDSLGKRLRTGCEHLFAAGYQCACAVGVDCPTLTANDLLTAHAGLENGADVVLGPAADGGYYLAGCTPSSLPIFDLASWSTPRLLADTLDVCRTHGFGVNLLETRHDIDTIEDYHTWAATDPQGWHASGC